MPRRARPGRGAGGRANAPRTTAHPRLGVPMHTTVSLAPTERPTFREMLDDVLPVIGVVFVAGPPVIFLAAPWLLLVLMLSGPFALVVAFVVVGLVAAALLATLAAIVVAPFVLVRRLHRTYRSARPTGVPGPAGGLRSARRGSPHDRSCPPARPRDVEHRRRRVRADRDASRRVAMARVGYGGVTKRDDDVRRSAQALLPDAEAAVTCCKRGPSQKSVVRLRRLPTTGDQPGVGCRVARGSCHRVAGSSRAPSPSDASRRIRGLDDRPWPFCAWTRYPPPTTRPPLQSF